MELRAFTAAALSIGLIGLLTSAAAGGGAGIPSPQSPPHSIFTGPPTNPVQIRGQVDLSLTLARHALERVHGGIMPDTASELADTLMQSYVELRAGRQSLLLKRSRYNPLPELIYNGLEPAAAHLDHAWRLASEMTQWRNSTEADVAKTNQAIAEHLEAAIPIIMQYQDLI